MNVIFTKNIRSMLKKNEHKKLTLPSTVKSKDVRNDEVKR